MVKTDIITSIIGSQRGRATILVIIYVETFKIDIIVFYRQSHVFGITVTNDFHYLLTTVNLHK